MSFKKNGFVGKLLTAFQRKAQTPVLVSRVKKDDLLRHDWYLEKLVYTKQQKYSSV